MNMTTTANSDEGIGHRTIHEFKRFAFIFLYLYITLGAILLMKAAVLQAHGIDFVPWGIAALKAAVLAKFILIGHALKLGDRGKFGPLIWPTLYGSMIFLLLLVILTILEDMIVGFVHGQSVAASLGDLVGRHLAETAVGICIVLLVLIPYFAFRALAAALGVERLVRLFFGESARFILR
jgi:hypothetical protein